MSTSILRSAGSAAFAFTITFGLVAMLAEQPAGAFSTTNTVGGEEMIERVSTSGLDLASPAGQKRLETRLRAASRKVCAPLSTGRASTAESRCRSDALKSAALQVASLTLRAQRLAAAGQPSQVAGTIAIAVRSE